MLAYWQRMVTRSAIGLLLMSAASVSAQSAGESEAASPQQTGASSSGAGTGSSAGSGSGAAAGSGAGAAASGGGIAGLGVSTLTALGLVGIVAAGEAVEVVVAAGSEGEGGARPPPLLRSLGAFPDCIISKLNSRGPHHASFMKKRIADYCGVSYQAAFDEWVEEIALSLD